MAHPWVVGTGFLVMMTGVLLGNVGSFRMVSEVNKHVEPQDRFSPYWWSLSKTQRLRRLHKELFPKSATRKTETIGAVIMLVGFCTIAVSQFLSAGLNSR